MRVVWLSSAEEDMALIRQYLGQYSTRAAGRVSNEIADRGDELARFPWRGRVVPEFGEQRLRELIVGDYRLLYVVLEERVEIHAVVHGSMDLRQMDPAPE